MNADIIRLQNDFDTARERLSAAIEAELGRLYGYGSAEVVAAKRERAAAKAQTPAKKRVSAEVRASRELQGRYISFQRGLNATWKKRLAKAREETGDRAKAINRVKREMAAAEREKIVTARQKRDKAEFLKAKARVPKAKRKAESRAANNEQIAAINIEDRSAMPAP